MSGSLPLIMTTAGPSPTPPATINAALIAAITAVNPGYTVLPGGLIEDISSTCTGALVALDQARVDAVNDVTPLGANAFVLAQQGAQEGLPQGLSANGNVYVLFTGASGAVGYAFSAGFLVSDGTNQYALQDGGVIQTGGSTGLLYAVATNSGTFAIPAGTVTQIVTSIPSAYASLITVTNPNAGVPAAAAETVQVYRSRVLLAQAVACMGTPASLKTALYAILGVQQQLVSIVQTDGGWQVICGGGDPYAIGNAILNNVADISTLVGSQISPSTRNVTVSIIQNPNTYSVLFVNPPQQVVTVAALWNTTAPNFTAGTSVNQLAIPAMAAYINSIPVGQPINLLDLQNVFQNAVASVLPIVNLTTLQFTVTINGTTATPTAGTSVIQGDAESYFYCSPTGATSVQ